MTTAANLEIRPTAAPLRLLGLDRLESVPQRLACRRHRASDSRPAPGSPG